MTSIHTTSSTRRVRSMRRLAATVALAATATVGTSGCAFAGDFASGQNCFYVLVFQVQCF